MKPSSCLAPSTRTKIVGEFHNLGHPYASNSNGPWRCKLFPPLFQNALASVERGISQIQNALSESFQVPKICGPPCSLSFQRIRGRFCTWNDDKREVGSSNGNVQFLCPTRGHLPRTECILGKLNHPTNQPTSTGSATHTFTHLFLDDYVHIIKAVGDRFLYL